MAYVPPDEQPREEAPLRATEAWARTGRTLRYTAPLRVSELKWLGRKIRAKARGRRR